MKVINNIEEFAASSYATAPLFKAATIEESYAMYVEWMEKSNAKASKKRVKVIPTFTMEDLKANRTAIINHIIRICDDSMLKNVMQKMVDMVNDGTSTYKTIFDFASAAMDELEGEGMQVRSNAKITELGEVLREKARREQAKGM